MGRNLLSLIALLWSLCFVPADAKEQLLLVKATRVVEVKDWDIARPDFFTYLWITNEEVLFYRRAASSACTTRAGYFSYNRHTRTDHPMTALTKEENLERAYPMYIS